LSRREERRRVVSERGLDAAKLSVSPFVRLLVPAIALLLFSSQALGFDEAFEPVTRTTSRPRDLWLFLPVGYLFTVLIETPVLVAGMPKIFSLRERFFAGLWLTACTYPVVVLVLPTLFASQSRSLYLLAAETFAPVAECALFLMAFRGQLQSSWRKTLRAFAVITLANLLSFALGEVLNYTRWFGLF
jgi:hypothetical protein